MYKINDLVRKLMTVYYTDVLTDETSTLITGMRSRQLLPTEPAPGCGLGREPPVSWPLSTKA